MGVGGWGATGTPGPPSRYAHAVMKLFSDQKIHSYFSLDRGENDIKG